jgi:hypothetical protein
MLGDWVLSLAGRETSGVADGNDRYLRLYHAVKRLRSLARITSKKPDLTFLSKMA